MSCREAMRRLADGGAPDGRLREHLAGCEGCRRVLADLETAAVPDALVIAGIKGRIASNWRPVKAMPSLAALRLVLVALFVAFSVAYPSLFGYAGFHALTLGQKMIYFGLLALCAIAVGDAVMRSTIPGARVLVNLRTLLISVALVISLWVVVQFPFVVSRPFLFGEHCLAAGSIATAISSLVFLPLFRKGVPANVVSACAGMGFFCGLAGIAVLAFHCPVQASPHIMVWHLSVLPIAVAAGTSVGLAARLFDEKKYSALRNS